MRPNRLEKLPDRLLSTQRKLDRRWIGLVAQTVVAERQLRGVELVRDSVKDQS